MKEKIALHVKWFIKAPLMEVFNTITDFEKWPKYFPKVAESIQVIKHEGNNLEIGARSAKYIAEILKEYKYPLETIEKISKLVKNHEIGGDKESDILRDADSLAYFEYNIPFYVERNGEEKAKRKIQFMYKRASSEIKK